MPERDGPLLLFGPRSTTYDFGPGHPLTPRRFGPGIDLLRHVGAVPGLAPEPASDEDLLRVHLPAYLPPGPPRRSGVSPLPGRGGAPWPAACPPPRRSPACTRRPPPSRVD